MMLTRSQLNDHTLKNNLQQNGKDKHKSTHIQIRTMCDEQET